MTYDNKRVIAHQRKVDAKFQKKTSVIDTNGKGKEASRMTKQKQLKNSYISEVEKKITKVNCTVEPLEREEFYRQRYLQISKGLTPMRQRRMKEYYCISGRNLQELKDEEFKRMLHSYRAFESRARRKAFKSFLGNYVVVDYDLLERLINEISSSRQQRYNKWVTVAIVLDEGISTIKGFFRYLDSMTDNEKRRVKEMWEYNQNLKKVI